MKQKYVQTVVLSSTLTFFQETKIKSREETSLESSGAEDWELGSGADHGLL